MNASAATGGDLSPVGGRVDAPDVRARPSSQPTHQPELFRGDDTVTPTTTLDVDPGLVAFYTDVVDEARRLSATARGRLEAIRVRELLGARLPAAPGPVADVGGGPGAHSRWLTAAGYVVDLIDPVPHHVEAAHRTGVRSASVGDARSLPWPDESYALALWAGPVYHLPPDGRKAALAEAVRVTRPGGLMAVVTTNRYANLIGSAIANQYQARREVVADILDHGYSPRNDRVRHMYYHSPEELEAELDAAGLAEVSVHGLSGPGGWLTVAVERHFTQTGTQLPAALSDPAPLHTALQVARISDDYPALTALSAQLVAFGRRP